MALALEGRVGLWYVRTSELDDPRTALAIRDLLTPDERKKHLAYVFDKHRHEYLVTRVLERGVLAMCLGKRPADLSFTRNDYGRPELTPRSPFHFNLTNTVAMVACAVTVGRELGIDAEPLSRADDIIGVRDTVFTPNERAMLDSLELSARRRRAVELWTLKEAYMKARGMGMSIPVDKFELHFEGPTVRGIRFQTEIQDDPSRWLLATREVTDHLVSVCVERIVASETAIAIDIEHADLAKMLGG